MTSALSGLCLCPSLPQLLRIRQRFPGLGFSKSQWVNFSVHLVNLCCKGLVNPRWQPSSDSERAKESLGADRVSTQFVTHARPCRHGRDEHPELDIQHGRPITESPNTLPSRSAWNQRWPRRNGNWSSQSLQSLNANTSGLSQKCRSASSRKTAGE